MPTHAQNVDSRLRGNDSGRRVGDLSHSRQSIRKRCCTAWVTACSLTHPTKLSPAFCSIDKSPHTLPYQWNNLKKQEK